MNKVKVGIFWLVLFMSAIGFGQADIWYIGSDIKFDFSNPGDPVVSRGIPVAPGGDLWESSTAISDANGDFLFGVIGDKIYDANLTTYNLPASTWNASQGSLVFPKPGSPGTYYLVVMMHTTNGSTGGKNAKYYEITPQADGSINNPVGVNLLPNLTQAQSGVPKIDLSGNVLDDYWLVTHESCNDGFKVFSVDNAGISLSSTENAGNSLTCDSNWPPRYDDLGTIKFNTCYTQFAYATFNKVMLFDFNAVTGGISHVNTITTLPQPFGVEFSPNGQNLFVNVGYDNNTAGQIYKSVIDGSGLQSFTIIGTAHSASIVQPVEVVTFTEYSPVTSA